MIQPFSIMGNQFVSGGLILMLTGAVMGLLRQLPSQFYGKVKDYFTITLTISEIDPLFEWTKIWLDSLPYAKKARNISCSLERDSEQEFNPNSRTLFTPAIGSHFFRHNGRLIWLDRSKPEAASPAGGRAGSGRQLPSLETIHLTLLGTKQEPARALIREIITLASANQKQQIRGFLSGGGWWRRLPTFQPRLLETVDVPADDLDRVVSTIDRFLNSRAQYVARGIPYHLNFLFAGLPGTGKTSLASALCGRFGLHLHLLNLAGPHMNDDSLVDLMLSMPQRSILLMEDVDALVPDRKTRPAKHSAQPVASADDDEPSGVTLSGLLNCMDGLTAPEGVVIIMTTNHPELLDPALLRPGRVDVRIDFREATKEQLEKMCQRLYPDYLQKHNVDWMTNQGFTTAQAQATILSTAQSEERD